MCPCGPPWRCQENSPLPSPSPELTKNTSHNSYRHRRRHTHTHTHTPPPPHTYAHTHTHTLRIPTWEGVSASHASCGSFRVIPHHPLPKLHTKCPINIPLCQFINTYH